MSPGKHYRSGGQIIEIIIIFVIAVLAIGGGLTGYLIGKGKKTETKSMTSSTGTANSGNASGKNIFVPGYNDPIPQGKKNFGVWELDLTNAKEKYRRGESIDFKLTLKNTSNEVRSMTFNTEQKYELEARDADGNKVWQWSSGKSFAQTLSEETFQPGEAKDYSVFWSQQNSQNKQVLLGKYYIVANMSSPEFELERVVIELEISEN